MIVETPHRRAIAGGIALAFLLVAPQARAGSWESLEALPGRTPISDLVGGKARIYFRVTPGTPLEVPIEGPGRLRLVSRVEAPKGAAEATTYVVTVAMGGKTLERSSTESSAAEKVRVPGSSTVPGKGRRMTVDVPAGMHRVTIALSGATSMLVRLHRAAGARGEEPTVSLTPVLAEHSRPVIENEKTVPYYALAPGRPVRFRVVGPTSLDLLTRLDYDATMRGVQTYRVEVSEKGKILRSTQFKTTKAAAASYAGVRDRIPSKFDRMRLAVAGGVHEVDVALVASPGRAGAVHARIPQPIVGNEE